jgi:hypothetical protein
MVPGKDDDAQGFAGAGGGLGRQSMHSVAAAVGAAVLGNDTTRHAGGGHGDAEPSDAANDSAPSVDGAPSLTPLVAVLPDLVQRAERARQRFTLVLARPGDGVAPGDPVPPVHPAELAGLAAAVHASLEPGQQLYSSGDRHVAAILDGKSHRRTTALMESAAGAGAPTFTWVACHYPEDARSAAGLVNLAEHHLDGVPLTVADDDIGGAMWWRSRGFLSVVLGSAAALLLGLLFLVGGGSHHSPARSGPSNSGFLDTTGGSGSTGSTGSTGPTGSTGSSTAAGPGGSRPTTGPTTPSKPGVVPPAGSPSTTVPTHGTGTNPTPTSTTPTTTQAQGGGGAGANKTAMVAQDTTSTSLLQTGLLFRHVTMTATLSSATATVPSGQTITFAANNGFGSCTATTNGSGVASCSVQQLLTATAPTSYTATFAGITNFAGSAASATIK